MSGSATLGMRAMKDALEPFGKIPFTKNS